MAKFFQLVIATRNVHKLREYKTLLKEFENLDILSLKDFPHYTPLEENGKTFKENASFKALHASKALKKWVLADDSGLVVPALKGEPGIFSARYAGKDASDADNRKKLLANMQQLPQQRRDAFFECCIALAFLDIKKCSCSSVEGRIAEHEKGGNGFGYDPLFIKNDYSKTFAQLEESLKNKISHRSKALEKIKPFLQSQLEKN